MAGWTRRLLPAVLILSISIAAVLVYGQAYPVISPYDEMSHLDALHQALHFDVVRRGERVGVDAIEEAACAGAEIDNSGLPPCPRPGQPVSPIPPVFTNADLHPPSYYLLTAQFARVFLLFGADTVLQAGRIVGGLWLGMGLLLFWIAAQALRIGWLPRVILMALIGSAPIVMHASSIVNPDASSLVAGAAVLLAGLRWEQGRWPVAVLIGVALLAGLFRSTNALAIGGVAVYLVLRAMAEREGSDRTRAQYLSTAAALVAAGALSVLGWAVVREVLAVSEVAPTVEFFRDEPFGIGELLGQASALLSPLRAGEIAGPISGSGAAGSLIMGVLNALVLAACFGPLMFRRSLSPRNALGIAGAVAMLSAGSVLAAANLLVFGVFFPIPVRYGLSLVPLVGLALAARLRRSPAIYLAGTLALASVAYAATSLLLGA